MLTDFDRWQQRMERAALHARRERDRIEATPAADVAPTVNWDATFASILAPKTER